MGTSRGVPAFRLTVLTLAGMAGFALCAGARPWLSVDPGDLPGTQRVVNPGLESMAAGRAEAFDAWGDGYALDEDVRRRGARSARCTAADASREYGVSQTVFLNQTTPTAFEARCWSRAQGISGTPDADYSLYLDLEYADGTPLWGQIAAFSTGTHDWEPVRVLVVPAKPVRSVRVLGLVRRHTGTAWFDDFELYELHGASQFDLVRVSGNPPPPEQPDWRRLDLGRGLELLLDRASGAMTFDPSRAGGIILRDAAADGALVLPSLSVREDGGGLRLAGPVPELGLRIEARVQPVPGALRLDVEAADTTGRDRAVSVYWALPLPAGDWLWYQDPRRAAPLSAQGSAALFRNLGAGANGQASWYPFAALGCNRAGLALGAPLDVPRLARFAADGPRQVLYAAFDLGLSPDTARFPRRASCAAILFSFSPEWGFRAALERYYDLNPDAFLCRVGRQGTWMPFQDIATVPGWEDFGFQFQEGAPNPAFDDDHGICSFPYIEPMSCWLPLEAGFPREPEAALRRLRELADRQDPQALATLSSVLHGPDGTPVLSFHNAPWCDGVLFLLNPDPDLGAAGRAKVTQFALHRRTIDRVLSAGLEAAAWTRYAGGFSREQGTGRGGSACVRVNRGPGDEAMGLSQTVTLNQTEPRELTAQAWSRAENVAGTPDTNYCLYLDLTYADGTHLWARTAAFPTGTHDWAPATVRVAPEKPVRTVAVHLLFRGDAQGTAWFDDVSLTEAGETAERVADGSFEAPPREVVIDGLYLDSFEMGATLLNYRREHFAGADIPLVFDGRGRVCQLGHFLALEMLRDTALELHRRGRLVFANAVLHTFPWPAAWLDVLGTETNWNPGGQWTPDSDEKMLYWRALCRKKPYVTLQNTDFDRFPPELVERYLARCCAYGVLPGFFSPDAANGVYWTRPELFERDRPLFRRYIPIAREVAEAGWEPVTHARSDQAGLWVERFGSGKTVFLTAFNAAGMPQEAETWVDLERLVPGGRARGAVLLPETEALPELGGPFRWRVRLSPERVAVLRLTAL